MRYNTLEEIIAATCEAVRPSERLSVSQAAVKYRYLNNPGSYVGPWDNAFAPYLVEIQDTFTSMEHTAVVFAGPARCGKSELFFNWLGHTAICDPADMMLVHMTQNTGRDWSQGDLQKVLRNSKAIGEKVMPGRRNMNVHDVKFINGMRLLIKWPTITELSGKTIPRLWLMDMDRMTQNVDGEGHVFDLTKKRAFTFGRFGMCVAESSPGFDVDDPRWISTSQHEAPPCQGILGLYNRGDRRRWYWQCPWCKHPYEPDFKYLQWPESSDVLESAEAAFMACPHCGGVVTQEPDKKRGIPGKFDMNQLDRAKWIKDGQTWLPDGTVEGKSRRSEIASFWLKGPAAAFGTWKDLVYKYLQAQEDYERTGSEESLRTTTNVDQGLPYTPKNRQSDRLPEDLKSRAQDLGERVVPEGVRFLVATVDVQKNRFEVQVHGFGVRGDIWIIDRFILRKSKRKDEDGESLWIQPGAYLEDWDLLIENVLEKTYPLADESGRRMQIRITGCDSGGREGVTKNAYDFYRRLKKDDRALHKRFQLIKGATVKTAPRVQISYPDSERKDRHAGARGEIPVLFLNPNLVKDQLNAMLDRTKNDGGKISFPAWLPDSFYTELTVETRTEKGWENLRKQRNEAWDLLAYAIALSLSKHVRIEQINWSNPPSFAAEWDKNDLIYDSKDNKRFASQPKSDYNLAKLAEELA